MANEAKKRYDAKNSVYFGCKFNIKTDADIINYLKSSPNKQGIIKKALREYIKKSGE